MLRAVGGPGTVPMGSYPGNPTALPCRKLLQGGESFRVSWLCATRKVRSCQLGEPMGVHGSAERLRGAQVLPRGREVCVGQPDRMG